MRRSVASLLALSVLAALLACGGSPAAPKPVSLTGTWIGTSATGTWNLTLSEAADHSISGSGTVQSGGTSIAVTVTGTHADPAVSLTLASSGFADTNYSAHLTSATEMSGTLNGSGFSNEVLVLDRG